MVLKAADRSNNEMFLMCFAVPAVNGLGCTAVNLVFRYREDPEGVGG